MKRTTHLTAMAALAVLAMVLANQIAVAQPDPESPLGGKMRRGRPGWMQQADVNNDPVLTFEELSAVNPDLTQEQFNLRDKNSDGVLTRADRLMKPRQGHGLRWRGGEADTNGDGVVTFEELAAVRPALTQEKFNMRDKNGDGLRTRADRLEGLGHRRGPRAMGPPAERQ